VIVNPSVDSDYRAVLTPLSCDNDTSTITTITMLTVPTATITGDASICSGSSSDITITFTGTAPYDFTFTDGTTPTTVNAHGTNSYVSTQTPADTATYTVTTVSDAIGCSNTGTGSATLNVIPHVSITTHPSGQTVCPGDNVTFTTVANGVNLTYQWKKDGVDIVGETNPSLIINAVAAGDAADYSCVVSSTCGAPVTSNNATLALYDVTAITTHPASATLCDGDALLLSIVSSGSILTYQWKKDGVDIAGETTNAYNVATATSGNNGNYTCVVSGQCGTETSNIAVISVDAPLVITSQPSDVSACPSDNVSFTVTATGTNLTYQWKKDGIDIGGETSHSLVINNVAAGNAGTYTCEITSDCGETTTTNNAVLTVGTTTVITAHPSDATECEGDNISFTTTATGSALAYQWYKDGVALADGGSISGSSTNILIITGLVFADNGTYHCEVSGSCGTLDSDPANLIVDNNIAITTQTATQTACNGDNISFVLTATGSNLSYQWYKDGVAIGGETSSTLNLNSVTAASNGDYRCNIANTCGETLNSSIATLAVNASTVITAHPSDATECLGNNANFAVTATGSNLSYQWYKDGVAMADGGDISGSQINSLVISNLDLTDAATYYCKVTGDCSIIDSDPADLTVDDAISITTQPTDQQACSGDNISFSVVATGSNLSYQWQKNAVDIAGATSNTLALIGIDATDVASYRCVISNSCGSSLTSQSASLSLYTNTAITTQPSDVTECIGSNASFSVVANGSNLTYQWKKDGVALADGGNINGSTTNTLNITTLIAGNSGVYTCEVSGSCGTENSDPANLAITSSTSITTHPSSQSVCENGNAVFSIVASGENLTYQWQKDGVNIVGATTTGYIINNVAVADAGVYRCVVTGDCGVVSSNGALLTINTDVQITSQPLADVVCENDVTGFSITATGTGLSYQWRKDGVDLVDGGTISGATTANLSISAAATTDAGSYSCVVTGSCSNEASNTVSLSVNEEIIITTQPTNKTACPSENIIFNIVATGANLAYQWQKDGVNIGGETNSALLLTNVTNIDEASYRCIITGDCGSLTSNAASLTVEDDVTITLQPSNMEVCEGVSSGFTINATGSGLTYQWKIAGVDIVDGGSYSGATTNNLTIDPVATTHAGAYTCLVSGTCSSENSSSASLTVDENISITSQPSNKIACPGDDIAFNVIATGTNLTYQWQKDGVDLAGKTTAGLLINSVSAANAGVYRCVIDGDCGQLISTGATLTVNEDITVTSQPSDATICENNSAAFVISATGTALTYQWKKNGVDLIDGAAVSGATTNSLLIDPADVSYQGVYTCEITGTCETENSNPANLVVSTDVAITAHPSNVSSCVGDDVIYSVTATGTNLSYQWQKDGVDMVGETNNSLTLVNVDATDAAIYRCVVTGDCGLLSSNGATLTVDDIVNITTQPAANPTLCEGDNLSLAVIADGAGVTYQWQKDGINLVNGGTLSGATSDNLIITGTTVSDDGIYTCIVTGSCGSDNSTLSDVVINPTTSITTHPVSYTIVEGGDATFTTVANG
ncbi:MAG: immunoglobulin domain-containing protein, partial [Bacteroidales bacterium]|nr:immunoglobulin domain-containing protein [Bacteroidales bacterium]